MPHKKRLGGGWTNPSEKYAQVKLDLISLNMQGENSKNIWVATTKTNGWNPLKNLDGLYFPFPAPFLRWTSREPFFGESQCIPHNIHHHIPLPTLQGFPTTFWKGRGPKPIPHLEGNMTPMAWWVDLVSRPWLHQKRPKMEVKGGEKEEFLIPVEARGKEAYVYTYIHIQYLHHLVYVIYIREFI